MVGAGARSQRGTRVGLPALAVHIDAVRAAALGAFAFGLLAYVPTLLPGVAFGDWAEMQTAPALLEVPHPTGYPLFVLVGRLWLFVEPFGSVAWRMNLFAAVSVAAAAAIASLVAARLGARPLLALAGGMTLVVTGTVWDAATVAEVNSLHLLLVALLLLLAVRWRDGCREPTSGRSDRDLLLGGLVGGLAIGNHVLTIAALAVLIPAAVWAGRRRLDRRPAILPLAGLLGILGLGVYLFIPLRVALSGPTDYPALRTWEGIWNHITGVAYQHDVEISSPGTLGAIVRDLPGLVGYAIGEATLLPLLLAAVGVVALARRDGWAAFVTGALSLVTVWIFVGYRGDLPHYLLVAWLAVAIWVALGLEALVAAAERSRWWRPTLLPLAVAVPLLAGAVELPNHDLATDTTPTAFVDEVHALLPPNAILFTYWDAGEALHHAQCVEHERPDLDVIAPDDWVSFRPCTGMTADAAIRSGRPLYALAYADRGLESIRGRYVARAVTQLAVPFGGLALDHTATLLRLTPTG
ncbi:MAG TPA: DUF2723 domain-containing protein [Candidatus Limnocylindrales bacterium]|nr:DUF2723 domain-containing protein [Candidatus Limnocylindrales bacterium]